MNGWIDQWKMGMWMLDGCTTFIILTVCDISGHCHHAFVQCCMPIFSAYTLIFDEP